MTTLIEIRTMDVSDLARAHELTQAERWPHRADDWAMHFDLAEGWVAVVDNQVAGTTLLWTYGDDEVATVGLIVVDRDFQGRGIGRQLLQHAIHYSRADEIRLVATEAGLKLYMQNEFVKTGEIRQCQGEAVSPPEIDIPSGMQLRELHDEDLKEVTQLDSEAFGCSRANLISRLMSEAKGLALTKDEKIISFAFIREGGRGLQFGPVVAEDENHAKCLIASLLPTDGRFTRIDITDYGVGMVDWLAEAGLVQVDLVSAMTRCARSIANSDVETGRQAKTFALVSQAFG